MLRRVFRIKMYEMTGQRNLYSEELHNLYALPYAIRLIKSKTWTWPVACMGEDECVQDFGGKARREDLDKMGEKY
jgi:hypothetical protein